MLRVCAAWLVAAVALSVAGSLAAGAATSGAVSVHVQGRLSIGSNVHINFHPTEALPSGGYYYAVIVLKPYKHYTRAKPPPCSTSSNMERTDYGYPHASRPVELALTPTRSATGHWCRGGAYLGAVYAVPQPPPCESTYPCRAEPYKLPSPCWGEGAHRVCGVVALPKGYEYPGGLPSPLAKGTRIIGRFNVTF
ncbi:MAG TPA: hypothetical protein VK272_00115 [Solirubrobacteraceae bacterium]|nr:hypothetical protein [Solirubrobacteraceae bacterium]